jgi:hypothetical protein
MPHYETKVGRHFVSYITGPRHVRLGVCFSDQPTTPTMIKQPPIGDCIHGHLDEGKILQSVLSGLEAFERETGTKAWVSEIVYVENDSPAYDLFASCALLLARNFLGTK